MILRIRQFFTLIILITVLYGAAGVSIHTHTCKSSGTTEAFFYPEVFGGKPDCGCEDETSTDVGGAATSFNDEECCLNNHLYLKADFKGFTQSYQAPQNLSSFLITAELPDVNAWQSVDEDRQPLLSIDHPPPIISGKRYLSFLHKFKIPEFISC